MKQLLSLSKDRKESKKPSFKQIAINYHLDEGDQQQNFIYEENDKNDGPSDQQIRTYAEILGIKLPEEEDLLYLAKQCLNQPMPPHWRCEEDQRGEIIYVNEQTGEVSFDHPCDQIYKQKVIAERKKKIKDLKKSLPKINIQKSKTSFVQNVFKTKQQTSEPNSKASNPKIQTKPQNSRPIKNLEIITNQQIISNNKPFLYDDDFEPVHPIRARKNDHKVVDQEPKKPKKQGKKQVQSYEVKLNSFSKKSNPALLLTKRQQIQERLKQKYQNMTMELQKNYISQIKHQKQVQSQLKSKPLQELKQQIGQQKLERKRKQIEMRLMLQHSQEVQMLRLQNQRQYRLFIAEISSKYQIENLFTELARCRKFFKEDMSGDREEFAGLLEMETNLGAVNRIQIQKIGAQLQGKCHQLMHNLLLSESKSGITTLPPQKQSQLITKFNQKLTEMIQTLKSQHQIPHLNLSHHLEQRENESASTKDQKQIYEELQKLKRKLKQLQQENNTQRSNLSDKQNKLYELLQNKVGSSSSRSERR